jgi:NAD(P) transhydrogenase
VVEDHYDLVVVGAGPAGEKAAAQAAYFDKRVVIVERASELGGELAASALTTKAMREAALYLTGFRRRDVYGAGMDLDPQSSIDRLRARAAAVAGRMSEAVRGNLDRHGIELVTVVVAASPGAPARVLSGEMILIATGSRPFHPPGIPFDDPDVLDSETARELDKPMKSLVVVGGGAVACEYASIFMALGEQTSH